MNYYDFINNEDIRASLKGSSEENISKQETALGFRFPEALRRYLLLAGDSAELFDEYHHHGTKELLYLYEWIYDWITRYKSEGVKLDLDSILPFFKWQDTFFYVHIQAGVDDPEVFAFHIHETPEIVKINDSFSAFIKDQYTQLLEGRW